VPKSPRKKSEDGLVVTPDFIAVIDGSTSKTDYRHSLLRSNGRQAMHIISRYLSRMPKDTTCDHFLRGVTAAVRRHYKKSMLPRLAQHPEDRLTASVAVYSRLCRQLWLVGDCQCLATPLNTHDAHTHTVHAPHDAHDPHSQHTYYDNPKPAEAQLAAMRADEVRRQLAQGKTVDQLLRDDTARPVIIPHMLETMQQQNIAYSVVDGFPIPKAHVRVITLDFQPWELVLATDGYPFLMPTLDESEARLQQQRLNDPLNIGPDFQATKAFHPDNNSFDDRTYVRFQV